MAQAPPFWQPDQTWDDLLARYGASQRNEVSSVMEPVPVAATEAGREEAPQRARRLAGLRRAILLADVLGPPRALRGGGFRR